MMRSKSASQIGFSIGGGSNFVGGRMSMLDRNLESLDTADVLFTSVGNPNGEALQGGEGKDDDMSENFTRVLDAALERNTLDLRSFFDEDKSPV
ncbi:unnamed protein product [Protopolystoma xenopodis]|uniref:Uncharacterized protein n=1 Tax=Protopolystoma xenopodis TaxID=117903 RepID=A0A3S5A829_9PLAT|nr:unnamed protein product [Protopolystoma xenopodis]